MKKRTWGIVGVVITIGSVFGALGHTRSAAHWLIEMGNRPAVMAVRGFERKMEIKERIYNDYLVQIVENEDGEDLSTLRYIDLEHQLAKVSNTIAMLESERRGYMAGPEYNSQRIKVLIQQVTDTIGGYHVVRDGLNDKIDSERIDNDGWNGRKKTMIASLRDRQ